MVLNKTRRNVPSYLNQATSSVKVSVTRVSLS